MPKIRRHMTSTNPCQYLAKASGFICLNTSQRNYCGHFNCVVIFIFQAEQLRRDRIIQRQKEIEEAKKKEGESSFLQSEDYQKKLSEIESLLAEEFGLSSDDDTISEGGMESSNEESSKTEEVSITKLSLLLSFFYLILSPLLYYQFSYQISYINYIYNKFIKIKEIP